MAVRLAFSVAIHVDPEILLVDEALSVGDIYFRQRCMRKVHELREQGVTILFVIARHRRSEGASAIARCGWTPAACGMIGDTERVVNAIPGGDV